MLHSPQPTVQRMEIVVMRKDFSQYFVFYGGRMMYAGAPIHHNTL